MGVIGEFAKRYVREYDFYDQAARLAHQLIEQQLRRAGTRCIVTDRAKSLDRAVEKAKRRDSAKQYQTVDEIYADLIDLAGVRVALYFPGERDQVGKTITDLFRVDGEPRQFPATEPPTTYGSAPRTRVLSRLARRHRAPVRRSAV
jgi:ppGpp synthetase/RelA/SpoT-type nucleotidyltranferase